MAFCVSAAVRVAANALQRGYNGQGILAGRIAEELAVASIVHLSLQSHDGEQSILFRSGRKIGDPVPVEFYRLFEGAQQRVDPVRALTGENFGCVLPRVVQPGDLVFCCHLTLLLDSRFTGQG
jgi:hypothetical protein